MRRMLKWAGIVAGSALTLGLISASYVYVASESIIRQQYGTLPETVPAPTAASVVDAERQMHVLGCFNCHGEKLEGRVLFSVPGVAQLYAPNLTYKVKDYTDQQLAQAIRQGVSSDGIALWGMPSKVLTRLADTETAAMISYMRSLPISGSPTPPSAIGPLGRLGILLGDFKPEPVNIEEYRRKPPQDLGSQYAKGRRLAMLVCADCHGPDLAGDKLATGQITPALTIVGSYDQPAFAKLMKTGLGTGDRELGLMSEVSLKDFAYFTEDEVGQIYEYLKATAEKSVSAAR